MLREVIKKNAVAAATRKEQRWRRANIVIEECSESRIREQWIREKVAAAIREAEMKMRMRATTKAVEEKKKMARSLIEEA